MVERVDIQTIADQAVLAAGGNLFGRPLDMLRKEGFASLHLKTSGAGIVRARYRFSNDAKQPAVNSKDWVYGDTDIVTSHAAGSSLYPMPDESFFARYLQVELIETTTTDAVTIDAWFATQ